MQGWRLIQAFEYAASKNSKAVLVIRNGHIVAEWYAEGWDANTQQSGFSIAKSFASALVGMLIEDGLIEDVDQAVSEFVPEWRGLPNEQVTIRHLLSMTSGLHWDALTDLYVLPLSPDQNAVAIGLPLDYPPASRWVYHNGAVQVLSEVIRNASGLQAEDYAFEKLWSRIGMWNAWWQTDEIGNTLTYKGVVASAREFAKFGYLFLRNGEWDGEQIIHRRWVSESTSPSQDLNPSYGYLWWLNTGGRQWPDVPADAFAARGLRERRLYVVPSLDIVAVRLGDRDTTWSDNEFLGRVCAAVGGGDPCTPPWFTADAYAAGDGPRSLAVSDLNDDGEPDLVVTNVYSDDISVLLNNGGGSFAAEVRYGAGDGPRSVAVDDLDGDGDPDLAVANGAGGDLSVLRNNGDGTFVADVRYGVGILPTSVAAGDLDGDGDPDLAVANFGWPFSESNQISVLFNNGDGTFAAEVRYDVGDGPHGVAIGDLDGDGHLDLVAANSASQDISVLFNNGDGTLATQVRYGVSNGPEGVAIRDLDGDGHPDLTVANFWSKAGGGGGGPDDDVSVLLNNGDGTFATEVRYGTGNGPVSIAVGDLNDDGYPDLAVPNFWSDDFSVLLNRGDGTFAIEVRYGSSGVVHTGHLPHFVTASDLDGDGRLDLAMANLASDNVSVLFNLCPPGP